MVDLEIIKHSIFSFVEMGYLKVEIVKVEDEFYWKGDKINYSDVQYNKHFIQGFLV